MFFYNSCYLFIYLPLLVQIVEYHFYMPHPLACVTCCWYFQSSPTDKYWPPKLRITGKNPMPGFVNFLGKVALV